jgi:hypothetical protein
MKASIFAWLFSQMSAILLQKKICGLKAKSATIILASLKNEPSKWPLGQEIILSTSFLTFSAN